LEFAASSLLARRVGLIQRIIADVGVPVEPVFVADGVGLERQIPPTRPRRSSGDFPLCHLALRRLTRARFARSADLALEAVLAARMALHGGARIRFSKTLAMSFLTPWRAREKAG